MTRPPRIDDDTLLMHLSRVFRREGYEAASLGRLAEATGLKKASLYHRFPGGKAQMAREVLAAAQRWLDAHVLAPLQGDEPPAARIRAMTAELDRFYEGGTQACLLNILSSPPAEQGPFDDLVRGALTDWHAALVKTLRDHGLDADEAAARAQRALVLIQGSLVLARGLGTPAPFQDCLAQLEDELLGPPTSRRPA